MDAFTDLPSSQKGSNLKVLAYNLCIKTAKNCNQKHRKKTCFLQTTGQKACPGFLSSTRAPNASWGMAFKHQGRHLGSTFSCFFWQTRFPRLSQFPWLSPQKWLSSAFGHGPKAPAQNMHFYKFTSKKMVFFHPQELNVFANTPIDEYHSSFSCPPLVFYLRSSR